MQKEDLDTVKSTAQEQPQTAAGKAEECLADSTPKERSQTATQKASAMSGSDNKKSVFDYTDSIIAKGNKVLDRGEKYLRKLIIVRTIVTVFMVINIITFLIIAAICSFNIYKTVSDDGKTVLVDCNNLIFK